MKKEEFLDRLENLDDDLILEGEKKMKKNNKKWLAPLIACSLVVVIIGGKYVSDKSKKITPLELVDPIPLGTSEAFSRKFFFYDGSMYAFVNQLEDEEINKLKLGKKLDELKFDLNKEGDDYKERELLTNFLVGESLYEVEGYNPKFRLAVKSDGNIFLAEKVNNMNEKDLDLKDFFGVAELSKNTQTISIYDHMGIEELKKLDKAEAEKLIANIEKSKQENPTYEEFEKIARAQSEGKSFKLVYNFKDGTTFEMYLIPELETVSVGDNQYKLDEVAKKEIKDVFEGLKQTPLFPQ